MGAREDVRDRQAHRYGPLTTVAAEPDQARQTLRQQVLAGKTHPRPLGTIAGDAAVDQAWIQFSHDFVIQPGPPHAPAAKVIHHHIRLRVQMSTRPKDPRPLYTAPPQALAPLH